jgi:hypothetical protein
MLPLPIMSQHSILSSYGDIVELDYEFSQETIDELKSMSNWIDAPNGKTGINLTGPIEDLGLNSDPRLKHAENQEYNENLLACPSIKAFFDKWTNLARCRAVTMNKGSYFALHRDAFRMNNQFRIFIPLNKTNDNEWVFMYDDRLARFKPGRPYILNTRKQHGSFAMVDGIYHILMSVHLNQENLKTIASMLPNCEDH